MRISDWSSDVCSSDLFGRHFRGIGMRCEAGVEKCRQPDLIDMLFEIGIAEGADILACRALRGIVEQCFLEEERMRRVGDDQPRDAVRDRKSTRLNSSH